MAAGPAPSHYRFATTSLRHWRQLLTLPVGSALVALGAGLLLTTKYTSTASFLPENDSKQSIPLMATSLAAQFGVNLQSNSTQSPLLYAQLVNSRRVREALLLTQGFPKPGPAPVVWD